MGKWRSPKLWITLASLTLIGVALVQQSAQLRQQSLDSQGWWWLLLGLGLTWLSILINGLAWRVVCCGGLVLCLRTWLWCRCLFAAIC